MIIGYFADGPWSHKALAALINKSEVKVAFICARYASTDPILIDMAEKFKIPYLKHKDINSSYFIEIIKSFKCDIFVSMSFDQIFGRNVLDIPVLGVINCHAGMLPFYRGRNVLNWALINDEKEFGVTVHQVDEGIDTGDIILQKKYPITDLDDYSTLLRRAHTECANLLIEAIENIILGNISRQSQSEIHPFGFYCTARKSGDERLDWNQNSRDIFNFVRAVCPPGPSARCSLDGYEAKIHKVRYLPDAPKYIGIPGVVLQKDNHSFFVKTRDTFIQVLGWDLSKKIKVGDRFT